MQRILITVDEETLDILDQLGKATGIANRSAAIRYAARKVAQVDGLTPCAPTLYWSHACPQMWIIEHEGGMVMFPANEHGWAGRRSYRGPREALHQASSAVMAAAALELAGYSPA